ncbi:SEFIR domain-containing protein [Guptibacillus hwajinpoensis]|nr:SEFIR domain-containing protein [Pseudalkalibacillus hwajinpoensis]
MEELISDKTFISYAWSNPEHEQWVMKLAERLTHNGVDVVLDKWDSVEGQDLNAFMLQCVNHPSITKVLVICDEVYSKKANEYQGGVGTETVIISDKVFKDVEQTKFVPIVAERDQNGNAYLPTYLNGKKYIDMSTEQNYEDGYEKLIRNLFGKPEFVKPEKGKAPSYLLRDEKKSTLQSQIALNRFKHDIERRPRNVAIYFNDFAEVFRQDFKTYALSVNTPKELEEKIFSQFHDMIELRNIYLKFLESYIRETDEVDSDLILELFESLYPLIETTFSDTHFNTQFEHMNLFVTEIVIYTIAVLYKNKKYKAIKNIIANQYLVVDRFNQEFNGNISLFRAYPELIENLPLPSTGQKYISNSGQLIIERANYDTYSTQDIIESEFLMFFLSSVKATNTYFEWYPLTSPYVGRERIEFMSKLKSKRFFENIKELFDVTTREEMVKLTEGFKKHVEKVRPGGRVMQIYHIIPPSDKIASI